MRDLIFKKLYMYTYIYIYESYEVCADL